MHRAEWLWVGQNPTYKKEIIYARWVGRSRKSAPDAPLSFYSHTSSTVFVSRGAAPSPLLPHRCSHGNAPSPLAPRRARGVRGLGGLAGPHKDVGDDEQQRPGRADPGARSGRPRHGARALGRWARAALLGVRVQELGRARAAHAPGGRRDRRGRRRQAAERVLPGRRGGARGLWRQSLCEERGHGGAAQGPRGRDCNLLRVGRRRDGRAGDGGGGRRRDRLRRRRGRRGRGRGRGRGGVGRDGRAQGEAGGAAGAGPKGRDIGWDEGARRWAGSPRWSEARTQAAPCAAVGRARRRAQPRCRRV